jgi:hypothetical protein
MIAEIQHSSGICCRPYEGFDRVPLAIRTSPYCHLQV